MPDTEIWSDFAIADVLDLTSLGGGEPRHSQHTGIKALMVAMLDDAIQCYVSPTGRVRAEAESWIASGNRRRAFSFCVVCETLGLDPDAVRTAVQRLPRSSGRRRRPIPRTRSNARRTGAVEQSAAPQ
ncbi:MAG TPA: hypothetical protein VMW56_26325 [Candidatus Margulisiibacteriota bacterium]|nr:hypothetical protein [Candidatus Margulisiibacteriota bacterium]